MVVVFCVEDGIWELMIVRPKSHESVVRKIVKFSGRRRRSWRVVNGGSPSNIVPTRYDALFALLKNGVCRSSAAVGRFEGFLARHASTISLNARE